MTNELQKCWIFDIDGTLTNSDHRQHLVRQTPRDWDEFFARVKDDAPIQHVCDLAGHLLDYGYSFGGYAVIFMTGRPEKCRADTLEWLETNGINIESKQLYMRPDGDYRDDTEVKLILVQELRRDGFEPVMVFDDRNKVVAAWRAAGIPCAQVALGDF